MSSKMIWPPIAHTSEDKMKSTSTSSKTVVPVNKNEFEVFVLSMEIYQGRDGHLANQAKCVRHVQLLWMAESNFMVRRLVRNRWQYANPCHSHEAQQEYR